MTDNKSENYRANYKEWIKGVYTCETNMRNENARVQHHNNEGEGEKKGGRASQTNQKASPTSWCLPNVPRLGSRTRVGRTGASSGFCG